MIHIYTGNGKGKTTAGIGLAVRAAGSGLKVFIGQFLKKNDCGELKILRSIKNITIEQFGLDCQIKKQFTERDKLKAEQSLLKIEGIIVGGKYDVIILDEIIVCVALGLLKKDRIIKIMKSYPAKIELIMTGRNACQSIIKYADLVSEVKERKHYFQKGLIARKGIEF
ncbi:MAG: cob(I)yrinic acid a,c-diamide adenosyltransferase [Candidatus Omnitrophica bacterium]|nr:cob(I)yrinic acid a,c-diamide adenosyltransferase [Candidatus Omnitrophota bacterium]